MIAFYFLCYNLFWKLYFERKHIYRDFVKIENTTLQFNPTSHNVGQNTLMLELVDSQGLTNSYVLNVNVVDQFEYSPAEIDLIQAKYSKSTEASISKLLNQFANHSFSVSLKENNQDIKWVKYIPDRQSILISNLAFRDIGVHNLSVSIFDGCYLKTFTAFVIVQVVAQHPPTVVGTISNVTAVTCRYYPLYPHVWGYFSRIHNSWKLSPPPYKKIR